MSYIGVQPTAGQYRKLDNISSGFNGSTTSFTTSVSGTNVTAGTAQQLLVSLGGVIQQPDTDYTVSTNTITFTTAPTSGLTFFAVLMGDALNTVTTSDGAITTAKLAGNLSVGLAAGTASAPSLYFTGDTNTGVYSLGADQVAISTGGTGRLFVDASGRVGIGTSSVTNSLHVVGTGDAVARLAATSDTNLTFSETTANKHWNIKPSAGDFYVQYSGTAYNSGYSSLVTIKNTGAVGIGTTSPVEKLDVATSSGDSYIRTTNGTVTLYSGISSSFTSGFIGTSTSHPLVLGAANAEKARIDTSGRLLVGTSTERASAYISTARLAALFERAGGYNGITIAANENGSGGSYISLLKSRGTTTGSNTLVASGDNLGGISFEGTDGTAPCQAAGIFTYVDGTPGAGDMPGRLVFSTTADGASSPTERMRITNVGDCRFGTTSANPVTGNVTGVIIGADAGGSLVGYVGVSRMGGPPMGINRGTNDGNLIEFYQDGAQEGNISVSGTTVSYNGAHLSRWSQLPSGEERTEILRGSVLSNIDEMCEWGDEENEQLNRMKVSDVEGDKNVAGVFQAWDDDDDTYTNDFYCAMTGDFVIRIGEGVTVERGDLLMSAGDGTAKPQDDDIIRSKTIAKVTSTNVSCTYDDGSYCVPCVLMAC